MVCLDIASFLEPGNWGNPAPKKWGHFENSRGTGNPENRKNVEIPKKGTFENFAPTSKIMMILMIIRLLIIVTVMIIIMIRMIIIRYLDVKPIVREIDPVGS